MRVVRPIVRRFKNIAYLLQKFVQRHSGLRCIPMRIRHLEGWPKNLRLVIGTKRGLFEIRKGTLTRIYAGVIYGVTFDGSRVLFYEQGENIGRILSLQINANASVLLTKFTEFAGDLPKGGHQIDYYDGTLFFMNTYNNSIVSMDANGANISENFPNGPLEAGRESSNYNHFNSINLTDNGYVVFAHNETAKTNKESEIWFLNDDFRVSEVRNASVSSGHNITILDGRPLYCGSLNGTLVWNEQTVFDAETFTRGLSLSEDYVIVGGSDYGERHARGSLGGSLFLLRRPSFELVYKMRIPGMVQEIRRLDGPDFAMMSYSECVRPHNAAG